MPKKGTSTKKVTSTKTAEERKREMMKKKIVKLREQIKTAKTKASVDCLKLREKANTKVSTLKMKIDSLKSKPQQYIPPFKYAQIQ
jgi:hypothetical protein